MPIYEYECKGCSNRFELRQGFDSDPMTDCPKCGELARRRISLVPVIFKGSGWYVTDYSRRNSALADDSGEEAKPSESKKKATPSEEKTKTEGDKTESTPAGASKEE